MSIKLKRVTKLFSVLFLFLPFAIYFVMNQDNRSRQKRFLYDEIFIALIRYFSNYLALHRSDLALLAAPVDP